VGGGGEKLGGGSATTAKFVNFWVGTVGSHGTSVKLKRGRMENSKNFVHGQQREGGETRIGKMALTSAGIPKNNGREMGSNAEIGGGQNRYFIQSP